MGIGAALIGAAETPPHTWRKSIFESATPDEDQKHLHIRGENFFSLANAVSAKETPPHTWRKSSLGFFQLMRTRNTSTYVEKILQRSVRKRFIWKHLHIRGENSVD